MLRENKCRPLKSPLLAKKNFVFDGPNNSTKNSIRHLSQNLENEEAQRINQDNTSSLR